MNPKILNGKALAKKHEEQLKQKLAALNPTRKPTIVSFCNEEDPPSVKYTEMKRQKASDIGIDFKVEHYSINTSKDEIVEKIHRYNQDNEIDGIMVQLPLPSELNIFQGDLLEEIDSQKDVDGLKPDSPFLPATVKAVISILDEYIENWSSKKIAVVGSTGEVGTPLVKYLKEKQGLEVVQISRDSGNLETDLNDAEIIVSATGQKNLIKSDLLKEEVVLIDVGLGDFDPSCYEKASKYTPVLGGVGPMTVISLMENGVESFRKKIS